VVALLGRSARVRVKGCGPVPERSGLVARAKPLAAQAFQRQALEKKQPPELQL
jgi:hypothetical protein